MRPTSGRSYHAKHVGEIDDREVRRTPKMKQLAKVEPCP
jgi:hypothetical protein